MYIYIAYISNMQYCTLHIYNVQSWTQQCVLHRRIEYNSMHIPIYIAYISNIYIYIAYISNMHIAYCIYAICNADEFNCVERMHKVPSHFFWNWKKTWIWYMHRFSTVITYSVFKHTLLNFRLLLFLVSYGFWDSWDLFLPFFWGTW